LQEGQYETSVPTVADRVAQTVVAARLEQVVEPLFHPDSYGYRPRRSALDAVAACRQRCWRWNWAVDLDIEKFFDSVPWDLLLKAVKAHIDQDWVMLYVQRWLAAPLLLHPAAEGFRIQLKLPGRLRDRLTGPECDLNRFFLELR
jgi:RNA-directed DNA polymerase